MWVSKIVDEDNNKIEGLDERLLGRYTQGDVTDKDGNVIVPSDTLMTDAEVKKILDAGIEEVCIRSILECEALHGVCAHCYGSDLASGKKVNIGEAVGIIAAQSIGEPGTQLTMRTFHTGGVAGSNITNGLPRVEELFEARRPKRTAIIAEHAGKVEITEVKRTRSVSITGESGDKLVSYTIPYNSKIIVEDGAHIAKGKPITEGSIAPADIMRVSGVDDVYDYIIREVQKVYRSQSVDINDKHIEVIARQMTRKIHIEDSGSTDMMQGSEVDKSEFKLACDDIIARQDAGEEGLTLPKGSVVLLGITKASLKTESFLSAASFQETTRVLTEAAIIGKTDNLLGLKENVIIGKLIPAGTGMEYYRNVEVNVAPDEEEEVIAEEIEE